MKDITHVWGLSAIFVNKISSTRDEQPHCCVAPSDIRRALRAPPVHKKHIYCNNRQLKLSRPGRPTFPRPFLTTCSRRKSSCGYVAALLWRESDSRTSTPRPNQRAVPTTMSPSLWKRRRRQQQKLMLKQKPHIEIFNIGLMHKHMHL